MLRGLPGSATGTDRFQDEGSGAFRHHPTDRVLPGSHAARPTSDRPASSTYRCRVWSEPKRQAATSDLEAYRVRQPGHAHGAVLIDSIVHGDRTPLPSEAQFTEPDWLVASLDGLSESSSRERSTQNTDGPPAFHPPAPGSPILRAGLWVGRYRLVEPLGSGGQAVVWRAVQEQPVVREVALKVLDGFARGCPRKLARLQREAERCMRLHSAALLPAFEFGIDGELAFMAMPLVRGCTLSQLIRFRRGQEDRFGATHPLSQVPRAEYLRGVLEILIRVARSLQDTHEAVVAHRDIKPSNILLDAEADDVGYLIDFGLARDLDVATPVQLRDGAGTPLYMSPEKLLGCQRDEVSCDLYALGVTIHEALTLKCPFKIPKGLSGAPLMAYLAVHRPKRPQRSRPALHPDLEETLARSMDPLPENRPASAARLADDLQRVLDSGSVLARRRQPRSGTDHAA